MACQSCRAGSASGPGCVARTEGRARQRAQRRVRNRRRRRCGGGALCLALVIQKAVEDMQGLARRRRDHLGVERSEAVGEMRIKFASGVVAVMGIETPPFQGRVFVWARTRATAKPSSAARGWPRLAISLFSAFQPPEHTLDAPARAIQLSDPPRRRSARAGCSIAGSCSHRLGRVHPA